MRGGVFVCHASRDAGVAQRVVAALEAAGVRCWIAPRDIDPGDSYSRAILDSLEAAPALVLVFSAATNDSPHVTRELEAAVGRGIPIVPVRLEAVEPSRDLRYFIGTSQWLDTGGVAADQWEPPLVRAVRRAAGDGGRRTSPSTEGTTTEQPDPTDATDPIVHSRRRLPWIGAGAVAVAAALAVVVVLVTRPGDDQPPDADQDPVPKGRAGMASVFPSLTDDCDSVDPALDTKSEVYVCRTDTYRIRYSRWDDGYGWIDYLDSSIGVASIAWTVHGAHAGEQWTYEVDDEDDPFHYHWTATYESLPFTVDVEALSDKARRVGIGEVEATPPGEVSRE